MIALETDAARINAIMNHKDIYPFVKAFNEGPLDFTEALQDPANLLLMGEHGGMFFRCHQAGLWEGHVQVLPEGRGPWALAMTKACLAWVFTKTDAIEVMARCPHGNMPVKVLTKMVGGEYAFTNRQGWVENRKAIPADIYMLPIQRWLRDADGLEERGEWFHVKLDEEFRNLGLDPPERSGEKALKRHTGAAIDMIIAGHPDKAVILFNRYAALAKERPMWVRSRQPLAIDIDGGTVIFRRDGGFFLASVMEMQNVGR